MIDSIKNETMHLPSHLIKLKKTPRTLTEHGQHYENPPVNTTDKTEHRKLTSGK